jgi:hypothetical protein
VVAVHGVNMDFEENFHKSYLQMSTMTPGGAATEKTAVVDDITAFGEYALTERQLAQLEQPLEGRLKDYKHFLAKKNVSSDGSPGSTDNSRLFVPDSEEPSVSLNAVNEAH